MSPEFPRFTIPPQSTNNKSTNQRSFWPSWQEASHIHGRLFLFSLALLLALDGKTCNPVKIVTRVFPWPADQQILLFIYETLTLILSHLVVGRELDRIGRARVFTKAAKDTA